MTENATRDTTREPLTVGQVAERFGVTRRTLHHYDEIGLVVPGERSRAGYRLYGDDDVTRLQQVVVYRRLGFALEEIAGLLQADAGPKTVEHHLRRQRAAVMSRLDELRELVNAIDNALEHTMDNAPLTDQDMRDLFGDSFDDGWAAEAEQRWGDTEQWRQSRERTKHFGRADWAAVKAETDAIDAAFVAALASGEPADGPGVMDIAERHRRSIEVHYDCPPAFHIGLAQMYLSDPRFTAYYDDQAPGLAQYVHDAIVANADRHTGS